MLLTDQFTMTSIMLMTHVHLVYSCQ